MESVQKGRTTLGHNKEVPSARDHGFDNIRCILVLCVVFSHLLEICTPFFGHLRIYCFVYSFHMPAFLFLFGYFARYRPRRILFGWVLPYVLFQTVYILFSRVVLGMETAFQYTTPYWLLWYLLVCSFYQVLLPMYEKDSPKKAAISLCVIFVISLLVGYEKKVEYHMALSRFFVFQPWFVLGYYVRKFWSEKLFDGWSRWRLLLVPVAVCVSLYGIKYLGIIDTMLYGTSPYEVLGYTPGIRAYNALMALSWICVFLLVIKPLMNRKLPLITALGENTLPVFLLHGFIVKAIPVYFPNLLSSPVRVIGVACGIVLVLGNPIFGKCFRYLFSDRWYQRLADKR